MPKLIYKDPESDQEASIEVSASMPEVTIGRNPGNVLRVNNPSISRRHAKIVWESGECTLHDLDSSNGSYINGNRIRSQVLKDGDLLRIGEFPIQFVEVSDSATAEVSAEMIESVLQDSAPHPEKKSTDLGGFQAEQPEGESAGPHEAPVVSSGASAESVPEIEIEESLNPPVELDAFQGEQISTEGDVPDNFAIGGEERLEMPDASDPSEADIDDAIDAAFNSPNSDADDVDSKVASERESSVPVEAHDSPPPMPDEFEEGLQEFETRAGEDFENMSPVQTHDGEIGVEKLHESIEKLVAERDELLDVLEGRIGDINAASKMQIERLRKERDRLTDERRNLVRQLGEHQKELQAAPSDEQVEALRAEVAEVKAANEETNTVLAQSQRELAERDDTLAELQAKLIESQTELEELRSEQESKDQVVHEFESQSAELGDRLSNAEDLLEAHAQELAESQAERDAVQIELDAALAENEELKSALEQRIKDLEERETSFEELERDLQGRDARIDELRLTLDEVQSQLDSSDAIRRELEDELEERPVAGEIVGLREFNEELEGRVNELQAQLSETEVERDDLEQALSEKTELVASLTERCDRVSGELDAIRRERDALKDERSAYARETDYLQTERRKLVEEVDLIKQKLKAFQKEDKRKRQVFDELSKDLRGLVAENNSLEDEVARLHERIETAPSAEELKRLSEENVALQEQLEGARSTIGELEEDASDLTRDLGKYAEEKEQLEARVNELEVEKEKLSEGMEGADALTAQIESQSELQEEIETLRHKLLDAEKTLSELILEKDRLEDELSKALEDS